MKKLLMALVLIVVCVEIPLFVAKAEEFAYDALYCVIDLSGGPSAKAYPVVALGAEPEGGWTDEYKTTKLVLRRIDAGTFTMGAGELYPNQPHQVTLTKPFYTGVFEVTQKQYELVMGANPSSYKGDMRPVDKVSYNMIRGTSAGTSWPANNAVDATSFLGKLRAKTGLGLDLPTEAQWEYACRAGTTGDFNNGGMLEDSEEMVRWSHNYGDGKGGYSDAHTVVGSYLPNAWGLYDMHGNVREWCLDWYEEPLSAATDPKGAASGTRRVVRGGSWTDSEYHCASPVRDFYAPSKEYGYQGFRLAWTLRSGDSVETFTLIPGEVASIDTGLIGYTASGLPSGLKYNKTTGMITGAATKSGEYAVKFTKSGAETEEMTITVEALPAWAVGNFAGTVTCADGTHGTASFTVSAAGAISSGKLLEHGSNWTFTAKSYATTSVTRGLEQDYIIVADAKCGKATRAIELHVMGSAAEGVAANAALVTGELDGVAELELWRNVWKDTDAKGVIAGIAGKYTYFFVDGMPLPLDLKSSAALSGKANIPARNNASVSFSTTVFASSNGVEAAFYVAADAKKGYGEIYERFALVPESGEREPGIAHRAPGVVAVPERYPNDEGYGTVSVSPMGGQVDVGKTVTVSASPDSKSVFVKWRYEVGGEIKYSEMSKLTLTMDGEHDVFASAIFRSKGSFKEPIVAVETSEQAKFAALELGVQFSAFVTVTDVENMKPVKWSASNLPSGLKINAETGEISGVATAVNSKPVVITATSVADSKKKTTFTLDIGAQDGKPVALPETAVGTFTGFVNDGTDNLGTFTFTSSEKGALSAKIIDAKGTVSFSGSGFACSKDGRYGVELTTAKGETLTLTLDSSAGWDKDQLTGTYKAANGQELGVTSQRNAFSKAWYFSAEGDETTGWSFAFTTDAKAAALTVTLKADGSTAIAGKLGSIKISASGSANVGRMREGAIIADFAPVVTVNKVKRALSIHTNLWFDRSNDHAEGAGGAGFSE